MKPLRHPSSLKWRNGLGEPILFKKLVSLNTRLTPELKEEGLEVQAQARPVTSVSALQVSQHCWGALSSKCC